MRALLFLVGGIVLANILWATFVYVAPSRPATAEPIVNSATKRGQDPWRANEAVLTSARKSQRKSMMRALEQPHSVMCSEEGQKKLASSLTEYWFHRGGQIAGYPKTWGEGARSYIVAIWSTPEDNRIDRLTREAYAGGRIDLASLKPGTQKFMSELLRGERVSGSPCFRSAGVTASR